MAVQGNISLYSFNYEIMRYTLLFIIGFFITANAKGQFKFADTCMEFSLHLKVDNAYSDTIVYRYKDCTKDAAVAERVVLKNGEIIISGFINRSAEMIINCDLKARFEDSSYYRLILEPGQMAVNLTMNGRNVIQENSEGSYSQKEKQKWYYNNRFLLKYENTYLREYSNFLRSNMQSDTTEIKRKKQEFQNKLDVLSLLKSEIALDYIKQHPTSYFSGALLFHFKRLYSTDTIMKYFNTLAGNVKQSDFGKYILDDVLKRTNNWEILSEYMDTTSIRKLINIKSVFDITLIDLNGREISLSQYKGKLLLFDFWGSWCGPCIASIPHINQLTKDLKGYPVEIISVAMETKENDWKRIITKTNYKGIHLNDTQGILSAYYNVLGAPKYIIVGPDGTLLNKDAPSPTTFILKETIIQLIKKYKF